MRKGTEIWLEVYDKTGDRNEAALALVDAMNNRVVPAFDIGIITSEIAAELDRRAAQRPKLTLVKSDV